MHSFEGHNDVLLRLWRQGNDGVAAFLEGDGNPSSPDTGDDPTDFGQALIRRCN